MTPQRVGEVLDLLDTSATALASVPDPKAWAATLTAVERRRLLEAAADIVTFATAMTGATR